MKKIIITILVLFLSNFLFSQAFFNQKILNSLDKENSDVNQFLKMTNYSDTTIYNCWYEWESNSSSWILRWKESLYYDINGLGTNSISWSWDVVNGWVYDEKSEFIYDSSANIIEATFYYWNNSTNQWVGTSKNIFTYNGGIQVENTRYTWKQATSNWVESTRISVVSIDSNNNVTERLSETWNTTQNSWQNNYKYLYVYYNNKLSQSNSYTWSGSPFPSWQDNRKTEIYYNANGIDSSSLQYKWISSNWELESKQYSLYDINNQSIETSRYNWDNTLNIWVGLSKTNKAYNTHGSIISNIDYQWDLTANNWEEVRKTITNRDSNDEWIESFYYNWDSQSQGWVNEYWEVPCPLSTNLVDNIFKNENLIFPNPSKGIVTIGSQDKVQEVKVYTIKGEVVFEDKSTTLDLTSLPNGIYYITVKTDFSIYRNKLVLIK